jgi:hypothetical protein
MMRAVFVLLTACVAPPMGIGTGARVRPATVTRSDPDWSTAAASAGVGTTSHREIAQLEGSLAHRFGPVFSLEYGAAITTVAIAGRPSIPKPDVAERSTTSSTATGTLLSIGILPYVRPRWQLGPLSIALAGTMLMGGGGEEGSLGLFADAQVGLGGERWSIYAGGYGLAYIDSFGTYVRASQARAGAELFAGHIGIAVEAFTGIDAIHLYLEEAEPVTQRFTGAGIKLRLER